MRADRTKSEYAEAAVGVRPIKPLPNQRSLPFGDDAAEGQATLFDDGRDLPGAVERDQRIIWDLPSER